jgi:hypothetical protein
MKKATDAAVRARVAASAAALSARSPADPVWAAAAAVPPTAGFHAKSALVRETLKRDPAHPAAVAWVKAVLPKGAHPPEKLDALEWLDFAEAAAEAKVRLVDLPPGRGEKGLDLRQRELGSARHFWRKDLEGIESDQLLLLTPLDHPARIARALSAGELVCETLERIFAVGKAKRDRSEPLIHHLYESKEEYLDQSTKDLSGAMRVIGRRRMAATAGHYNPGDRISRLFLPAPGAGLSEMLPVYAHELTHHWIDVRCPLFTDRDRAGMDAGVPGYWIVEGFATLVEEFRFDLATRSVTTLDPRAWSLDLVASADPAVLIPWDRFFDASTAEFARLPDKADIEIPVRWRLGRIYQTTRRTLFYAQAGAFCHWAFEAGSGVRRGALVQMVADYYTGAVKPDHVKALFAFEPAAAGAAVQAWAREITRPK